MVFTKGQHRHKSKLVTKIFRSYDYVYSHHGTLIQSAITCYKTPCYICDSACRQHIFKTAKIFLNYVTLFWIFLPVKNRRIMTENLWNLDWFVQYDFMSWPVIFLKQENKTKLVPASFFCFLEILWRKKVKLTKYHLYNVTAVIISPYCNKANLIVLFALLSQIKN